MSGPLQCWEELDQINKDIATHKESILILERKKREAIAKCEKFLRPTNRSIGLTRRENEVLGILLASPSLEDKEIAWELNISSRTVKFHMSSILAKFGVSNRIDLITVCQATAVEEKKQ